MPYKIKSRVYAVNKKVKDLIPELRKREIDINPPLLSNYINGDREGDNADKVLIACNEIVSEWEKQL